MHFAASEVPPSIFKYLRPEHADRMVESGLIRIGSLYGYRSSEIPDTERDDPVEGTATVSIGPGPWSRLGSDLPPSFHQFATGIKIHPTARLAVTGGGFFNIVRAPPNAFIYCACLQFEPSLSHAFGGACVEIFRVGTFLELLTASLELPDDLGVAWATRGYFGNCQYGLREQHIAQFSSVDPYLAKAQSYVHQREARAIWIPTRMVPPLYVDRRIDDLAQICQRVL